MKSLNKFLLTYFQSLDISLFVSLMTSKCSCGVKRDLKSTLEVYLDEKVLLSGSEAADEKEITAGGKIVFLAYARYNVELLASSGTTRNNIHK